MIVATETDLKDDKILRRIRFPLDGNKDSCCYRSRVSYEAFAHSLKRRCYKPSYKKAEFQYYCCQESDLPSWVKNPPPEWGTEPDDFIDVPDLWSFYNLVGYNYKKKNWKNEKEYPSNSDE